jgi:FeS assembly SUF system regulator
MYRFKPSGNFYNMFKINKLTDYSTVVMSYMAIDPHKIHNANDIMNHTHLAKPTVSKILKMLAKAKLLISHRGTHGGYQLAMLPEHISIRQIVSAIEGELALTECGLQDSACSIQASCHIRTNWRLISHIIYQALENLSLADLATPQLPIDIQMKAGISSSLK